MTLSIGDSFIKRSHGGHLQLRTVVEFLEGIQDHHRLVVYRTQDDQTVQTSVMSFKRWIKNAKKVGKC